jgi:hypothetical protein
METRRCQCRGINCLHSHYVTDRTDDFRCPHDAEVYVSTGSNPIADIGMCRACALASGKPFVEPEPCHFHSFGVGLCTCEPEEHGREEWER